VEVDTSKPQEAAARLRRGGGRGFIGAKVRLRANIPVVLRF
jgi:hypothetical protein